MIEETLSKMLEFIEYKEGHLYWKKKKSDNTVIGNEVGGPSVKTDHGNYMAFRFDGKLYLSHRVIHWMHTGEWPKIVDHEDHDTLNNYPANLRSATDSQNQYNKTPRRGGSSKYLGVGKFRNKWKAQIGHEKKNIHIGVFENEEDAARAYDEMAKKLAGAFANLNFKE